MLRAAQRTCLNAGGPLTRRNALATAGGALLSACRSPGTAGQPSVKFSRVPQAVGDGRDRHDIIEGTASGAKPGQQIVLYAKSGTWWLQPLVIAPFTKIHSNSKWVNATHLGTEYAALLVEPGYTPAAQRAELPPVGGPVIALTTAPGAQSPLGVTLQFSGYDWRVREAPSNRGGRKNKYSPSNAWIDRDGAMHLRIAKSQDDWTSAEVTLTRSLGYGTYSLRVRDTGHLEPAVVFSVFTWDYSGTDHYNREMDIGITRWGDPSRKNAEYAIQPYHVPANVVRFTAPAGVLTHSFHWEPGRAAFRTVSGDGSARGARTVADHVFTLGVPSPGIESIRMVLYVVDSKISPLQGGSEVVIEKFEYLP